MMASATPLADNLAAVSSLAVRRAIRDCESQGRATEQRLRRVREDLLHAANRQLTHTSAATSDRHEAQRLRALASERHRQLASLSSGLVARDKRIALSREALRAAAAKIEVLHVRQQLAAHSLQRESFADIRQLNERIAECRHQLQRAKTQALHLRLRVGVLRSTPSQRCADALVTWASNARLQRAELGVLRRAATWWQHALLAHGLRKWRGVSSSATRKEGVKKIRALNAAIVKVGQQAAGRAHHDADSRWLQ